MRKISPSYKLQALDRVLIGFAKIISPQIHLEMTFDRPLNADRLARAVDLTLDAEPVLGCRYQRSWFRPRWVRLPAEHRNAFALTDDPEIYAAFRDADFDAERGPQIRVLLLRRDGRDTVLLKVNHMVADGGGVKDIAEVLANVYRSLARDAYYRPSPNLNGSRSAWQVFQLIPLRHYPRLYGEHLRLTFNNLLPRVSLVVPMNQAPVSTPRYARRHLDALPVARLKEYGRRFDATLNDILLAAFLRALIVWRNWDGRSCLRAQFTIDFRRYLPEERAVSICNLSAVEGVKLGRDPGATFADTLVRIAQQTRRSKSFWPGLRLTFGTLWLTKVQPAAVLVATLRGLFHLGIKTKNMAPALTNMGPIRTERVTFDEAPAHAWLIPPPAKPGVFIGGVSGYAGTIDVSIGYYPEAISPEAIERFLDLLLAELPVQD